jgi:uncharacterized phage-associated protein
MTNTLISAVDLAVAILPNKENKDQKTMTLRKVQKLVYYCQAWSLVWDGVPLFKEDIVACPYRGPIVPELQEYAVSRFAKVSTGKKDLYEIFNNKGVYEIFNTDMDLCFEGIPERAAELKKYQEKTIKSVLRDYEMYDIESIEDLSKEEGPFKKAMLGSKGENTSPLITIESMQRYYAAVDAVRKREPLNREYSYRNFILNFPAWEGEKG